MDADYRSQSDHGKHGLISVTHFIANIKWTACSSAHASPMSVLELLTNPAISPMSPPACFATPSLVDSTPPSTLPPTEPTVAVPIMANATDSVVPLVGEDAAYQVDDFMVKHHPNSGLPDKVYHFEEFTRGCTHDPVPPSDPEPWRPGFASLLEFEFAELVEEAGLKKKHITRLLRLIQHIESGAEKFTFCKQSDIRQAWHDCHDKVTPVCV